MELTEDQIKDLYEKQLKPCPFCGGEAKLIYLTSVEIGEAHYCKCSGCLIEQYLLSSGENAMNKWNQRA